ncbi:hypothetical protein TDB9533_04424 [Thalassocella blandensis]|nr:hypothetical protein TDB9533_04424 [Thalassocella blandensis]
MFKFGIFSILVFFSLFSSAENNHDGLAIRSDENIRTILSSVKEKVSSEYNVSHKYSSNLSGVLIFSFTISQKGAVKDLKLIESSIDDSGFESFMLAAVKAADFGEQHVKPRKIVYKYNFQF